MGGRGGSGSRISTETPACAWEAIPTPIAIAVKHTKILVFIVGELDGAPPSTFNQDIFC